MKTVIKRSLALVMAIFLCTCCVACNKNPDDLSTTSFINEGGLTIGDVDLTEKDIKVPVNDKNKGETINTDVGVTIKGGTESMTKGLNFGGKTFTMAVQEGGYATTSFKAKVAAFEKQFNCKISMKYVNFGSFNSEIAKQMSTGKSYDIIYFHGSKFPPCVMDGLCEDLTNYITTADLAGSDASKGGIDLDKTLQWAWNGKLYGLCDWSSNNPDIFFYNKLLFKQYKLEDPRDLYEKGQWTWDKIFEIGEKVTDKKAGQYFICGNYSITQTYGTSCLYIENGKPVEAFSSNNFYKSLKLIQDVYYGRNGKDPIGEPWVNGAPSTETFISGKGFMYFEESSKWEVLAPDIAKSYGFNKDLSNFSIVPAPFTAENTSKLYPVGWYTGIAAGKGSDPKAAVAWAVFQSYFETPVKDDYPMSKADAALIKKLQAGKTLPNRHGAYANTSTSTTNIYTSILTEVMKGTDIAQAVANYYPQIISCMDTTVGKGNYTSKK